MWLPGSCKEFGVRKTANKLSKRDCPIRNVRMSYGAKKKRLGEAVELTTTTRTLRRCSLICVRCGISPQLTALPAIISSICRYLQYIADVLWPCPGSFRAASNKNDIEFWGVTTFFFFSLCPSCIEIETSRAQSRCCAKAKGYPYFPPKQRPTS